MNTILLSMLLVAAPPELPKGKLVVVGGGSTAGGITKKTLELAGGESCRMVIMPQSSASPDAGQSSEKHWREHGAKNTEVVKFDSQDQDSVAKAIVQIKKADLIWIGGGDQNRFMKAIAGTGIGQAIKERYYQGAVVGGTSAGAAVMSKVMITGEADLLSVKGGATKTVDGLGLWPEAIVDQHFLRRQRFNRLLSAVLDHPNLVGVGIDEGTAAIVNGTTFEAFGASQVLVLDGRGAKATTKPGELSAGHNVKLHLLTSGLKFDLGNGKR